MSRIKFIEARFYKNEETEMEIDHRLRTHLEKLRRASRSEALSGDNDPAQEPSWDGGMFGGCLGRRDQFRIRCRSQKLARHRAAATGLSHLNREDKNALEVLRDGTELVPIRSEDAADVIAAKIHEKLPWMASATEVLWHSMRRSVRRGDAGFRLHPLLLDGPPGIGKSMWARTLGQAIGVPRCGIDASAEQASFSVTGSQRGWGNALPGRPIQSILSSLTANPVISVDEVEKAARPVSTKGQAFGLTEGLLSLLEPSSAVSWQCPYYRVGFNMSWISWVLTSNSTWALPAPLLSRLKVLQLPHISVTDLVAFAAREGHRRGLSPASIEAVQEVLRRSGANACLNLRDVIRLLDRIEDFANKKVVH